MLAQNLVKDYTSSNEIENQISVPTFQHWLQFLNTMDFKISMEDVVSGAIDPYIIIPLHIQGMDSSFKWLHLAQILNNRYENDRSAVGTWVNIGGNLVLVKNTEQSTFYVSDHGNIGEIVTTIRNLAFEAFDWANPKNVQILVQAINILKKMSPEEIRVASIFLPKYRIRPQTLLCKGFGN